MKKCVLLVVFALSAQSIFGTIGGILQPVESINVSIEHKRLVITLQERRFLVQAYLELYNHENTAIEAPLALEFHNSWWQNIGFLNLPENAPHFVIMVNNEVQALELQGEVDWEADSISVQTLLFRPTLNPGRNTVYQQFHLLYGSFAVVREVNYRMQSNNHWKYDAIRTFEFVIQTEFNTVVRFHNEDSRLVRRQRFDPFDTRGQSRLLARWPQAGSSDDEYILTPGGYLHTTIQNFLPSGDIYFMVTDWHNFSNPGPGDPYDPFHTIHTWRQRLEGGRAESSIWWWYHDSAAPPDVVRTFTPEQLRILRNTLFALHGLVFNDPALNEHFNGQFWYFPNPALTPQDIVFDETERRILEYIIAEERRRM